MEGLCHLFEPLDTFFYYEIKFYFVLLLIDLPYFIIG